MLKVIQLLIVFSVFIFGCVPQANKANKYTQNPDTTATPTPTPTPIEPGEDDSGNNPPVIGIDQTVVINEEDSISFTLSEATDEDFDQVHYTIISAPTYGTISDCLTSSTSTSTECRYTPDSDFAGTDSFVYRAHDRRTYSEETATVTITVAAIEDIPVFVSGNSANITNAQEDVAYSLTYRVDEGGGADENEQIIDVTVVSSNQALLADSGIQIKYAGNNKGTADNSPISIDSTVIDAKDYDLVIKLTPASNQSGTTTLTLTIDDGNMSVSRSFDVTFQSVNDLPVLPTAAQINATVINEDGGAQALTAVTAATDEETIPASLTYRIVDAPNHGVLSNCLNDDNDLICDYTPAANFSGTDYFTYQAYDGTDFSTTIGRMNISVTNINDAPSITANAVAIDEGDTLDLTSSQLNASDLDNDPDELVYTLDVAPLLGTLYKGSAALGATDTFTQDDIDGGLISYEQDGSENIADSFDVTLSDGVASTASTQVNITITPINDGPVIAPATNCANVGIAQNSAFSCATPPSATDEETNTPLVWSLHATNSCSWASINSGTGVVSGTPNDDHVGTCSLKIVATDSLGAASAISSYTVVVTNVAPTFTNFVTPVVITEDAASAVIANDASIQTDEEGKGTYSTVTPAGSPSCSAKSLSLSIDSTTGAVTYRPSANFFGTCYVGVRFNDGNSGIINQDLEVTVTADDDIPAIDRDVVNQTTNGNTPIRLIFKIAEDAAGTESSDGMQFKVTSSNSSLINVNNLSATWDTTSLTNTAGVFPITDAAVASNTKTITLVITPEDGQQGSATISLAADSNPASGDGWTTLDTFTVTVNNVFSFHGGFYDIYANGPKTDSDGVVLNSKNAAVSFSWNSFTTTGSSISSWRIYRNFDYTSPYASISSAATLSYTDTGITNSDVGKIYYYEVAPVMANGIEAWPAADYRVLRVVVPPNNMTLLHRLTANYEICNEIGSPPDKENYNNCPYTGPGNSWDASLDISVYDLGHDLLLDMHELGCRYTRDTCVGGDGSDCIGTADPNGNVTAAQGSLYYRRANGRCYQNSDGVSAWDSISDIAPAASTDYNEWVDDADDYPNEAKLPPLTNISQQAAWYFCQASNFKPTITDPLDTNFTTTNVSLRRLPTRKEQIIASKWDSSAAAEIGTSLPSTFNCNTVNGSGLTYDNVNYGESGLPYSYHVTSTSAIKSVITGSSITANCISQFGLYDMIGNVAEWSSDRIKCNANNLCQSVNSTTNAVSRLDTNNNNTRFYTTTSGTSRDYAFDGVIGPCRDSNNDGVCDASNLTTWTFYNSTPVNNASEFFLPMGLPAVASTTTTEATATPLTIGTDLASSYFNNDSITINAQTINATVSEIGGFITGGSYKNAGDSAGRFAIEIFDATSYSAPYIGFRCAVQVDY